MAKRYIVHPRSQRNIKAPSSAENSRIYAARGDDIDEGFVDLDNDDLYDTLEGVADAVEDIQDTVDDIDRDDVSIDIDNNISGHYIAECEDCHGVFISAVVESDQSVEKVTGTCPLCEKETDQYLKWVIHEAGADT